MPFLIALIIRALALTLRFEFEDCCGITQGRVKHPVIYLFWHNRLLMVVIARVRKAPERRVVVLTSPSRDGALLAGVMSRFKVGNVRGSSSRRGGQAMRELISSIADGKDVGITPDGPRGPVYKMGPGAIKLAQITGAPIMPVHVDYSRFWALKSWDGFRIPKPFSRVRMVFGALETVATAAAEGEANATEAAELLESERLRIEGVLRAGAVEN